MSCSAMNSGSIISRAIRTSLVEAFSLTPFLPVIAVLNQDLIFSVGAT